ncbi:MAG: 1-(5-phosphoribosyl)-5-[(5-phosphoribosylamino)methylideneamino]imidazole-4-carboxamide isomerase [Balneolaceae bacterium]|nr:MAG: 1-(5-phosphoribosyl)-5-[(5-phosphoribosylamino)methylideneamino]imidazole-4-carboxamide isomerase [Balneolaceae bacterium]
MRIIPALDLLDGRVVRLKQGDYEQVTIYSDDPVFMARTIQAAGFNHIHLVDLNGARQGEFANLGMIREIIRDTGLSVQAGGGIRSYRDCEILFEAGINKIVSTSMAVRNEPDWMKAISEFGDKCILGMDLRDGKIALAGWLETAEESADSFLARMVDAGLREVLCTDISRDGMLTGPNFGLYNDLLRKFPDTEFIASGGVSRFGDLEILKKSGVHAVVVGRAMLESKISLEEMAALHNL